MSLLHTLIHYTFMSKFQFKRLLCILKMVFLIDRSLQGNKLTGKIPEVIGLMQALAVL